MLYVVQKKIGVYETLFPYFKMLSLKASYVLSSLWLRKMEQLLKDSLTGHMVLLIHL